MKERNIEERLDQMLLFIFETQDQLHWLGQAANNTNFDDYIYMVSDEYAKGEQ